MKKRLLPIVILKRLKKTAVQERYLGIKIVPVKIAGFFRGCIERIIEERFQIFVIEILFLFSRAGKKSAHKILIAFVNVRSFLRPKPALLLKEVAKNDLPQDLLGEGIYIDGIFLGELRKGMIFFQELLEAIE